MEEDKEINERIEKKILTEECKKVIRVPIYISDLKTVLNLIQKQQAEIEKKDKIIDLMTEKFENLRIAYFKKEDGGEFMGNYTPYNKNDWKQYFEKKLRG